MRHLITENDEPVDSVFSEKQMRLLTEPLYGGWPERRERSFLVAANVGVFAVPKNPALVPDVFLAMDVATPALTGAERIRSYFVWEFGKPPDVVIEVVSDTPGGELDETLRAYERMRVARYVVFDPLHALGGDDLHLFGYTPDGYVQQSSSWFESVGLGLGVWSGTFEGVAERWLRWCDRDGRPIPTGAERAQHEHERAEAGRQRAERLAARLRAGGIDPDEG